MIAPTAKRKEREIAFRTWHHRTPPSFSNVFLLFINQNEKMKKIEKDKKQLQKFAPFSPFSMSSPCIRLFLYLWCHTCYGSCRRYGLSGRIRGRGPGPRQPSWSINIVTAEEPERPHISSERQRQLKRGSCTGPDTPSHFNESLSTRNNALTHPTTTPTPARQSKAHPRQE